MKSLETRSEVAAEDMGYLGVTCLDVPEDISKQYDMPVGIYIKSVMPGCAADEAGLKKGDIIIKFGGISVTNYEALSERLRYYEAGRDCRGDGTDTERRWL